MKLTELTTGRKYRKLRYIVAYAVGVSLTYAITMFFCETIRAEESFQWSFLIMLLALYSTILWDRYNWKNLPERYREEFYRRKDGEER